MIARPRLITVLGWWLIVAGLFGVYSSLMLETNPFAAQLARQSLVPLEVQAIYGILDGFVVAACGKSDS